MKKLKGLKPLVKGCGFWAHEVVQTSAMDCGPAALKCLLEGFGIPASYGRLREICQTSVDGTSIDVIEIVARQLGLDAEQIMLPMDNLWIPEAEIFPALIVARRPDGANHFVVLWKRIGSWLQIMDPGVGRRWVHCARFYKEIYVNKAMVPAEAWLDWATSNESLEIFRGRLREVGIVESAAETLLERLKDRREWPVMAALDAALRMIRGLVAAGGIEAGHESLAFLESLLARTALEAPMACEAIPRSYWAVAPAAGYGESSELTIGGAVLMRVKGRLSMSQQSESEEILTQETKDAITEPPLRPLAELWSMIKAGGLLSPLALFSASGIAIGALIIEALLFRGFIDLATDLNLVDQRIMALFALLLFLLLLAAFEFPIVQESLRLGRHLESRLRLAIVQKLPVMNDRYFNSRPVSDMAERSHSVALLRYLPDQAMRLAQSGWELLFTLIGIGFIAPQSVLPGLGVVALAVGIAFLARPWMNELDLKLRSHNGALQTHYLDALLGIVPVRTHSAERSVRRAHEALLTDWARSAQGPLHCSLWVDATRSLGYFGLAGWILFTQIQSIGVSGNLLLLVYWVLKLPVLGERFATLILQYPAQRNVLLRLLEPLKAPEERESDPEFVSQVSSHEPSIPAPLARTSGMAIEFEGASIVAAGHTVLHRFNLSIAPEEHVAIVGPSGAGKSSLLGLLLGWHYAAEGRVLTDGVVLTRDRLARLRRECAWIDPAIQIWNRSLLNNLRFNPMPGEHNHLAEVLDQADLTGVLTHWAEGLQTSLGEGGARCSGGEGQRIRLGRALWQQEVRLVLLDEPFRGLDREKRGLHLQKAREHWRGATLLCVTHDVRETQTFDRVLVVENGRIVEDGSPAELLAACDSRYRALLEREEGLRKKLWGADFWRKLQLIDGRVQEDAKIAEQTA